MNKKDYLKEFNSTKNGPLHEQKWVKPEIDAYHQKRATLKPYFCDMCRELWTSVELYCINCSKNGIKFTHQNLMTPYHDFLPPHIKTLFEQLTMIEEMIISPIASVMSMFRFSRSHSIL